MRSPALCLESNGIEHSTSRVILLAVAVDNAGIRSLHANPSFNGDVFVAGQRRFSSGPSLHYDFHRHHCRLHLACDPHRRDRRGRGGQQDLQAFQRIAKGQELLGHTNQIVADLKPKIAAISTDLQPKIASISSDVQHISGVARAKTDQVAATVSQINETVQETNTKTREQVTRVRGMVSEALDTTHEVQRTVQNGIKSPIRQLAGVIAGLRVGLETLADRSPFLKQKPGPRPVAPVTPINRAGVEPLDL